MLGGRDAPLRVVGEQFVPADRGGERLDAGSL
jgi:hypothetical protein